METENLNMLPVVVQGPTYNKTSQQLAIRQGVQWSDDYVIHLDIEKVKQLVQAADNGYKGERNQLLIRLLFDGCLRCSEAIAVRPCDLEQTAGGWLIRLRSKKSDKAAKVAISATLASQLLAYAYRGKLRDTDRFFDITRSQAFRIVVEAFTKAGIPRPRRDRDRVGAVHILRHSGAIERLKRTGNPKAVQDQLRHKSALMTLRYLKTISADESLKIQQAVDFQW